MGTFYDGAFISESPDYSIHRMKGIHPMLVLIGMTSNQIFDRLNFLLFSCLNLQPHLY